MSNMYRQCVKCVMDTNGDGTIIFDSNGICNYCHTWEKRAKNFTCSGPNGEKKLLQIVNKIKQDAKGQEYDSIMGISGGVDSTYLAYQVKKYGLHPLVVHLDNGWNAEIAVKNIENIVHRLKLDLFTYVINWEEFKDLQLSYLKASVLDMEIPTDFAIVAALYKLAIQHKIKYIISGYNIATEGVLPKSWRWEKMDLLNLLSIHKKYGTVKLKTFPTMSFWDGIYYEQIKKIQAIQLLNYIDYNKSEAKKIIIRELGWRDYGGKHYENIFTRFYQGYILPRKFNIDKRKAHLSSLICSGQITKKEALATIQEPIYDTEQLKTDKEFVIKKFGLTEDEFEQIMNLPVRSHLDYNSYVTSYYKWHSNFFKLIRPFRIFYRAFRKSPEPIPY